MNCPYCGSNGHESDEAGRFCVEHLDRVIASIRARLAVAEKALEGIAAFRAAEGQNIAGAYRNIRDIARAALEKMGESK